MISQELEILYRSDLKNWLEKSPVVASFASQRIRFTDLLRLGILEILGKQSNDGALPSHNPHLILDKANKPIIFIDTLSTPFTYPNCADLKSKSDIEIDLKKSLKRMLQNINKHFQDGNNSINLIFSVYPTTHNDLDWLNLFNSEAWGLSLLSWLDFRFINNVPGVLYFGEIDKKDLQDCNLDFHEDLIENSESDKKRTQVKFKDRNTYNVILSELKKDMENGNLHKSMKVETVEDLQNIFEDRILKKLVMENPGKNEKYFKQLYQKQIDVAKKSQIMLSTINELNRLSIRSKIDSKYNLFVYDNNDLHSLPFKKRKIRAFNVSDESNWETDIFIDAKLKDSPMKVKEFIKSN